MMRRLLASAAAAILAACAPPAPAHFTGTALTPVKPAPAFTLTDQRGQPFTLAGQHGRAVLLFFGYTHCPDVCPATMAQLAHMVRTLTPEQRARVTVAFVTVDPGRDDPRTLRRYVALFDPAFVALTGSAKALEPVYDAYHVWHQKLKGTAATGYVVTHGSSIYLIDPRGDLRVLHDWQDPAAAIATDVKELLT